MNNEMYVVIGEDKETGETWICDAAYEAFDCKEILTKSEAEELIKELDHITGCFYRIAKLSWLD